MAAKTTPKAAAKKTAPAVDSKGLTRVYIDLPRHLSQELGIMAIRRRVSKRALLALLVEEAVTDQLNKLVTPQSR